MPKPLDIVDALPRPDQFDKLDETCAWLRSIHGTLDGLETALDEQTGPVGPVCDTADPKLRPGLLRTPAELATPHDREDLYVGDDGVTLMRGRLHRRRRDVA